MKTTTTTGVVKQMQRRNESYQRGSRRLGRHGSQRAGLPGGGISVGLQRGHSVADSHVPPRTSTIYAIRDAAPLESGCLEATLGQQFVSFSVLRVLVRSQNFVQDGARCSSVKALWIRNTHIFRAVEKQARHARVVGRFPLGK